MISKMMLSQYFERLIGRMYKILPLKEAQECTLSIYLNDLLNEMLGVELITSLEDQPYYVSLLGIVSYLSDNIDECPTEKVRRDVFHAINLCKKLEVACQGGGRNDYS